MIAASVGRDLRVLRHKLSSLLGDLPHRFLKAGGDTGQKLPFQLVVG